MQQSLVRIHEFYLPIKYNFGQLLCHFLKTYDGSLQIKYEGNGS